MADHDCPGGCGRRVPYELLACSLCWSLLPLELRLAIQDGGPRRLANVSTALSWYRDYRGERGDRPCPLTPTRPLVCMSCGDETDWLSQRGLCDFCETQAERDDPTTTDPRDAEATSSTSLDQPEGGAGYTAVEPRGSYHVGARVQIESRDHPSRGQIAAIIAMADDGGDMLDEIMSGPVATLVREARARVVHELLGTADLATGNWVLGDAAGVVHTALVGAAHELDHPDCEDSTIAHLAEWRTAWAAARGSR